MNVLPVARNSDIIIQELKGELLIYELLTDKVSCLIQTSKLVWNLCDGQNSVSEISRKLSQELKSPITEDFVWLALDLLKADNLLVNSPQFEIRFRGLSSREVIRKVGLATIVALPFVTSALAPNAIQAQSACRANGSICAQGSECCSGACEPFGVCVTCIGTGGFPLAGGCSTGTNSQQCCSGTCDPANPSNCL